MGRGGGQVRVSEGPGAAERVPGSPFNLDFRLLKTGIKELIKFVYVSSATFL